MRRLILFFCCNVTCAAVLCVTSFADSKAKTDVELRGLQGPVRSVHSETRLFTPDGQPETRRFVRRFSCVVPTNQQEDISFDRDGWITEIVRYAAGIKTEDLIFRRNGWIILSQETTFFTGPKARKEVQTNDAQGRPMELLISTLSGTLLERTERQYGTGGIRELTYDGSGKLLDDTLRTEKEERIDGGLVQRTSANGNLESVVTRQGTRSQAIRYSSDGTVKLRSIFETGNNEAYGGITTKDGFESAFTRDTAGNNFQISHDPKVGWTVTTSSRSSIKREHSDQNGNLLNTVTTSYDQYDQHGSWIHSTDSTTVPNSEPRVDSDTTRTITYYE